MSNKLTSTNPTINCRLCHLMAFSYNESNEPNATSLHAPSDKVVHTVANGHLCSFAMK